MDNGEYINWAELPPELMSSILVRLGTIDILENAQKVCRSWRRVCKDPYMWRVIDMRKPKLGFWTYSEYLSRIYMCRHAVDRSQGGLVEIELWDLGSDDLLKYIADRSSNLKSLRFADCSRITDQGFIEALAKLPQLEDLEMLGCSLSGDFLEVLGRSCPNMKTLKLTMFPGNENGDDGLAIAKTMPRLHHLQLIGNGLSDVGVNSILDNCPSLEHLDLRMCFNANIDGDLLKRCSERVKVFREPFDSTDGYPFGLPWLQ